MTDVVESLGDILLDITPIELNRAGVTALADAEDNWYTRRRRDALMLVGLVAAVSHFNPNQPRGKDGRWISLFGWVRWLEDGKWKRGQVTSVDDDGSLHVRQHDPNGLDDKKDHFFTKIQARQELYAAPTTKATLSLPSPKDKTLSPGFKKIGGQGGSNPGALYEVTSSNALAVKDQPLTPDSIQSKINDYPNLQTQTLPSDFIPADEITKALNGNPGLVYDNKNAEAYYVDADGNLSETTGYGNEVNPTDIWGGKFDQTRDGLQITAVTGPDQDIAALDNAISSGASPETGTQFYVKNAKSPDHAKNEALANFLYEMGGVPVPNVAVGADGKTVSSQIVQGTTTQSLVDGLKDPAIKERIQEDFVFDAWLANWDVAGLSLDNILIVDGTPFRIDAGGALSYRAQGGPKGNKFGNTVGELDTLSSGVNPQAAKLFGNISNETALKGVDRLGAISPQDIRDAVAAHGLDDGLADKLIARRKFILDKYGVPEPAVVPQESVAQQIAQLEQTVQDLLPESTANVPLPPAPSLPDVQTEKSLEGVKTLDGMMWAPALNTFVYGVPPGPKAADDLVTWTNDNGNFWGVSWYKKQLDAEKPAWVSVGDGHDRMWSVQTIDTFNDTTIATLKHPVTGELKQQYFNTNQLFGMFPTPNEELEYRDKWNSYATYATNSVSTEGQLVDRVIANGKNDTDFPTSLLFGAPSDDVAPGGWVVGEGPGKTGAFQVISKNYDHTLTTENLDGQVVTIDPQAGIYRYGSQQSMIGSTLENLKAQNKFAKDHELPTAPSTPAVTKTDTQMQKLAAPSAPASVSAPDSQNPPLPLDTLNGGVNFVGDPVADLQSLTPDEADKWVGKQVFLTSTKAYYGQGPKAQGVFTITAVKEHQSYAGKVQWSMVDSTGRPFTPGFSSYEMQEIDTPITPITQFQLKKDNTVVVNGVKIGAWGDSGGWPYNQKVINIDAQFSATGKSLTWKAQKSQLKARAVPLIIPPGSPTGTRSKSVKASDLEKITRVKTSDVEFGTPGETSPEGKAVTLMDGAKVKPGMYVISKTDGSVGKVSSIDETSGYVQVEMADGKIKGRAASTLSAAASPDGGAVPPGAPIYADVKIGDGTQPFPSQAVFVSGSTVESTIIQIKPDGSVSVLDKDGKKHWVSASSLKPAKPLPVEEITRQKVTPAGSIAAATADDSWKVAKKPGKIPYIAPGGVTISQSSDAVAQWRQFNHERKLTRDGFVPQIGMKVRDSKSKQFTITRVANSYDGNPNAVWLVDDYGAVSGKSVSALWVDHAADLGTADGNPLPKVSTLHFTKNGEDVGLPSGSVVYVQNVYGYKGGRSGYFPSYFVATPGGGLFKISTTGANEWDPKVAALHDNWSSGQLAGHEVPKKFAYIDETAPAITTFEHLDGSGSYAGTTLGDVWIHGDAEGALQQLKADIAKKKLETGVVTPDKFEGTKDHLIALPPPPDTSAVKVQFPAIPSARSDADRLSGPPTVKTSYSLETGLSKLKEQSKAGGPGSQMLYTSGDSNYIEDMAIRTQTAVDTNGVPTIELRFRLLEGKSDDLASRLIVGQSNTLGNWSNSGDFNPKDLVEGDMISLRISSDGSLKPMSGQMPNATVVGVPELVGVSNVGLPAYHVNVALANGIVTTITLEDRPSPSVAKYEWDPTKPKPSKSQSWQLNPQAVGSGWSVANANSVGYETVSSVGKSQFDASGQKIVAGDSQAIGQNSIMSHGGSYRLRYDDGDGGSLSVMLTNPGAEERSTAGASHSAIRSSVNGEVRIRVARDDPNAAAKISAMMAAVGIPPEAQDQPTAQELRKMALNKVYKQLAPTYQHLNVPNITGENDASAQQVLDLIDKRFGATLSRKATLDDIMIRTTTEGRVQVVFSDDVARAAAKQSGVKYVYHSLSSSTAGVDMFTSPVGTGLMSTDERWSSGILTNGMSSGTDVTNDAGNRVYFRLSNKDSITNGQVVLSAPAVMKQVDFYFNSGDQFGRRNGTNGQVYSNPSFGGGNEVMLKRKIDPDVIGYVMVGDEYSRQQRIKALQDAGVTQIGGRPLADAIIVRGTKTATDLGETGMVPSGATEIPLSQITDPVPTAAPPVGV